MEKRLTPAGLPRSSGSVLLDNKPHGKVYDWVPSRGSGPAISWLRISLATAPFDLSSPSHFLSPQRRKREKENAGGHRALSAQCGPPNWINASHKPA